MTGCGEPISSTAALCVARFGLSAMALARTGAPSSMIFPAGVNVWLSETTIDLSCCGPTVRFGLFTWDRPETRFVPDGVTPVAASFAGPTLKSGLLLSAGCVWGQADPAPASTQKKIEWTQRITGRYFARIGGFPRLSQPSLNTMKSFRKN